MSGRFFVRLSKFTRGLLRNQSGAAGVEIALWATALIVPIFGVADIGNYVFKKMQVEAAAQAAAGKAWNLCNTAAKLPATTNCTGLSAAMTTAARSTSLGSAVTIATVERYYCANNANVLVPVATVPTSPPATCNSVTTGSTAKPGDYVVVTANYTFAPMFGSISFSSLLPTGVTKTVWMRMS